jgi:hypothetical protein
MNSRIQRILQRQRAELDATPRTPRRWTAVRSDDSASADAADPGPSERPVRVDASQPSAPVSARGAVHDPALEQRLRRELDETLAEIARVEALSRAVQAEVQTAANRAPLETQLARIEAELRDLRALHRALRDELASLQAR